jgi:hypothetical protein
MMMNMQKVNADLLVQIDNLSDFLKYKESLEIDLLSNLTNKFKDSFEKDNNSVFFLLKSKEEFSLIEVIMNNYMISFITTLSLETEFYRLCKVLNVVEIVQKLGLKYYNYEEFGNYYYGRFYDRVSSFENWMEWMEARDNESEGDSENEDSELDPLILDSDISPNGYVLSEVEFKIWDIVASELRDIVNYWIIFIKRVLKR